ncbi:hypothetical protein C8J56DRAFT_1170490 [Mycena floridula]|nr:hypothetical protein C8J56DRAFT_1170490 [Mycena floridula]
MLSTRKRPHYKFHLGCMIVLFLLSTIHITLAFAWAFITDGGDFGVYELFSLKRPIPVLFGPDDPVSVRRIAQILKVRYALTNAIADGIIIYRCYVIWTHNWRIVAFPIFAYACTIVGGILGVLPLSAPDTERAALATCIATVFTTNVVVASLAAGRIWWITRRAGNILGRNSQRKYRNLTAILLESGLIYPSALIITIACFLSPATPTVSVLICIAADYHIVGIAPALIIVRVGLGVSTDDVDQYITTTRGVQDPTFLRGADTTAVLELQVRGASGTTGDEESLTYSPTYTRKSS